MNRINLLKKINEANETEVIELAGSVLTSKRQQRQLEKYQAGEKSLHDIRNMVTAIANNVEAPDFVMSAEMKDVFSNWFNK